MDDPPPDAAPVDASAITIHAVQFVGTNVEMTWSVDAADDEADARTRALLASKLGLFAVTRTGSLQGRPRFSVIASPLDRLFHKIGPSLPLTLIKHVSVTLDLSEQNLTRQAQGLMRNEPEPEPDGTAVWKAWDAGKLIGTLLRRPHLMDHGPVRIADHEVERGRFPDAVLPALASHVAHHDGVRVALPDATRRVLQE